MSTAVVIPCFRVKDSIKGVIDQIGSEVDHIIVVDDACPEGTGDFLQSACSETRLTVLSHCENAGVGGAVITGYQEALSLGAELVIKLDGDGQMDPAEIPRLIEPITQGRADYVKGNRFYDLSSLEDMPWTRLFGNSVFSFVSKASSGYWNIMDPTNGFTAIDARVLRKLPLEKIAKRYFFESDMLFRLYLLRAVILEVPMKARYDKEISNLSIVHSALTFPPMYATRLLKRIFYTYFLRDFNVGSVEILMGTALFLFGTIFGGIRWYEGIQANTPATSGTVMLAAVPVILGFQLLLSALSFDVRNVPNEPVSKII